MRGVYNFADELRKIRETMSQCNIQYSIFGTFGPISKKDYPFFAE